MIECEYQDSITDHEKKVEEEKLKSIIFLRRSDDARYKDLATYLKKGSYLGRDEYPKTVAGTYDLLNRHSGELDKAKKSSGCRNNQQSTGAMFAQRGSNGNEGNRGENTNDDSEQ